MAVTGPFENRNFRVKWDGRFVAGVSKISGLRWSADVVTMRDGATNVEGTGPGRTKYEPLTLERGVTFDLAFEEWAQQVMGNAPVAGTILKDLVIDLYDPAGSLVVSYKVMQCWPSSYEAMSVLDADGNVMVVERLMLEYATFERDTSVGVPGS
ncbi:phage tail protein [Granulicella arctica]|uniref:Phage tail-like protein n=1 Tax=Granulicella arctica TaxID=940613 RepID=A0A7Y9PLH4_9BACT|nr:phage tail protein [Granulicella arctica]NYF81291.1 phage tail-like protein [Granulicella arctica]